MDLELQKIYNSLEKYSTIDGIEEIKKDMEMLNNKLSEYKGMSRLNSYNVPTIIIEMDKINSSIEKKYTNYFDKFKSNSYSINVFGAGNDSFEQKIESSLSTLGKVAVSKICNHLGINIPDSKLNTSNYELAKIYSSSINNTIKGDTISKDNISDNASFSTNSGFSNIQDNDILETKMSFKVLY